MPARHGRKDARMLSRILAGLRRLRTTWLLLRCRAHLQAGRDLHVGTSTRLWAPRRLVIGHHVYIGKNVNIEANAEIGDFCLLANAVAIVGRHDHDFTRVGYPVRFSPWVGSRREPSPYIDEKAVIGADVWLGYGAIVLTGTTIGRGCIVAAGSVVTSDLPPYTIAAGIPARPIGTRFPDPADRAAHEHSLAHGRFSFSERGIDHSIIEPVLPSGRP